MPITLDGTLGITTPALTVTGATVNTGGISTAGNLTFTSTGNRITGDFSNATQTSKVAFQTSTTDGATVIAALPNGTGTISQWRAYNSNDPTNSGWAGIVGSTSSMQFQSGITGTGTYLPMTFLTGGSERMRIDTSGRVLVGLSTSGSTASKLQVTGGTTNVTNLATSYSDAAVAIVPKSTSGFSLAIASGTSDFPQLQVSANGAAAGALLLQPYGGNVGVGTSSPGSILDVSSASNPSIRLTDTGGAGTRGGNVSGSWGGNGIYLDSLGASGWVYVGSSPGGGQATTIRFDTSNTERMRIDSAGRVGIGTSTIGAAYALSVNGTGNFYNGVAGLGRIFFGDPSDSSGYIGLYRSTLGPSNSTTAGNGLNFASIDGYTFNTGAGSPFGSQTERMRITSAGNVQLSTANTSILNSSGRKILNQTGSILQVQQVVFTGTQTINATSGVNFTDITNLSITITPSSSSSKFLLQAYITYTLSADRIAAFRFQGGNSTAFVADAAGNRTRSASWGVSPGAGGLLGATAPMVYLDSPATTSPITYKVQGGPNFTSGTLAINYNVLNDANDAYIARGACSFIIMEIAG